MIGGNFGAGAEPVGEVGGGEGLAGGVVVGVEDHGAMDVGEEEEFVELLDAGSEFDEGDLLGGAEVDDGDAAEEFGVALLDGEAAEDVFFADLAEADEGEVAGEGEAAEVAGEFDDDFGLFCFWIEGEELAGAAVEEIEQVVVESRGVGHGEVAEDDFIVVDVDEDSAGGFVVAPGADGVGFAEGGDEFGFAVDEGQAV